MPYRYDKLRGRIIEKCGSQAKFADKIGLSQNSVSRKLNCDVGFHRLICLTGELYWIFHRQSMALIFLTEKLNGVKLRKGVEEVDTNDIHKTCEEIMGNCKKANTMSNIAIVCG